MSFLVVIEGIDRTGKSTLTKQLAEAIDIHPNDIEHFSKPELPPIEEYTQPLIQWDWQREAIFDRYHIGERVWPAAFERETTYTQVQHDYVEMLLKSRGAVMVHTQRNLNDVMEALVKHNEPLDPSKVDQVAADFRIEMERSILPVLNWSLGNPLEPIIMAARSVGANIGQVMDVTDRIIGEIVHPRALIIQDNRSQASPLPAYPDRNDRHTLIEALGYGTRELLHTAVVCADDLGDNLSDVYEVLGKPPVITLDHWTTARAVTLGIPSTRVPLFQYIDQPRSLNLAIQKELS